MLLYVSETFSCNFYGGETLRYWLINLRKRYKLTQANVAEKLNISRQEYSFIETGKRQKDMSLSLMAKLSKIFSISLEDILALERGAKIIKK